MPGKERSATLDPEEEGSFSRTADESRSKRALEASQRQSRDLFESIVSARERSKRTRAWKKSGRGGAIG